MKNIKFQHVAVVLALIVIVWLYLENKKKAEAAIKTIEEDNTKTYASTKDTSNAGSTVVSNSGGSGSSIILINAPASSSTPRYISRAGFSGSEYGNVASGGGGTSMGGSNLDNTTGGGTSGGGGGTSFNPGIS